VVLVVTSSSVVTASSVDGGVARWNFGLLIRFFPFGKILGDGLSWQIPVSVPSSGGLGCRGGGSCGRGGGSCRARARLQRFGEIFNAIAL
jgi:hypothetical protein